MVTVRRRALTDAEAWAIVCSPDVDAETLARRLDVKASTIRNARARFRRSGWTCRVAYVPCRWCGELLVQRGHRAGRASYHDQCRPASRRAIKRALDHRRWEHMSGLKKDALLARAHADKITKQVASLDGAVNAGRRWSIEDDDYLRAHWHEPGHLTARSLGRSLYAIWARKVRLRQRGA